MSPRRRLLRRLSAATGDLKSKFNVLLLPSVASESAPPPSITLLAALPACSALTASVAASAPMRSSADEDGFDFLGRCDVTRRADDQAAADPAAAAAAVDTSATASGRSSLRKRASLAAVKLLSVLCVASLSPSSLSLLPMCARTRAAADARMLLTLSASVLSMVVTTATESVILALAFSGAWPAAAAARSLATAAPREGADLERLVPVVRKVRAVCALASLTATEGSSVCISVSVPPLLLLIPCDKSRGLLPLRGWLTLTGAHSAPASLATCARPELPPVARAVMGKCAKPLAALPRGGK